MSRPLTTFPAGVGVGTATGVPELGGKVWTPGVPVPSEAQSASPICSLVGWTTPFRLHSKAQECVCDLGLGLSGGAQRPVTKPLVSWKPDFDMSEQQAIPH